MLLCNDLDLGWLRNSNLTAIFVSQGLLRVLRAMNGACRVLGAQRLYYSKASVSHKWAELLRARLTIAQIRGQANFIRLFFG